MTKNNSFSQTDKITNRIKSDICKLINYHRNDLISFLNRTDKYDKYDNELLIKMHESLSESSNQLGSIDTSLKEMDELIDRLKKTIISLQTVNI